MAQGIPRVIWTLWLQGWETAPPLVQACLTSWTRRNPTWTVRALSRENIGEFLDLGAVYPGVDLDQLSAVNVSDLIRIALLAEHGGVWADSTAFCTVPLDQWIDEYSKTGFFAFARPGPDRMLSNWFLASEPHHPITEELRGRVKDYWQGRRKPDRYFWFHQLFFDAYRESRAFRESWDATPEFLSDGPHYFVPYRTRLAGRLTRRARARILSGADPMYKLSHRAEHSSPHPWTAYALFLRWADDPPLPSGGGPDRSDHLLLATDRTVEKVRWALRHALGGLRAVVADRLRSAGARRPSRESATGGQRAHDAPPQSE